MAEFSERVNDLRQTGRERSLHQHHIASDHRSVRLTEASDHPMRQEGCGVASPKGVAIRHGNWVTGPLETLSYQADAIQTASRVAAMEPEGRARKVARRPCQAVRNRFQLLAVGYRASRSFPGR